MTKEELKKEAEDNKPPYAYCAFDTNCELWKEGYLAGAKETEMEFEKSLLEKGVCLQSDLDEAKEIIREYMRFEPMLGTCSFYSEEYEKTKKKAEAFLKG